MSRLQGYEASQTYRRRPENTGIKNTFSEASGLKLNLNKCKLMCIHPTHLTDIPIKSKNISKYFLKYLGIHISNDLEERENKIYGK